MKPKIKHIDDDYLKEEYTQKKRSAIDLATEFNVSDWWIRNRLKTLDIKIRRQGAGLQFVDITNKRFGSWLVIKHIEDIKSEAGAYWSAICDCGEVQTVLGATLRSGGSKSCGNCKPHHNWKGIEELSGSYFNILKRGAEKRKIPFDLTKEYVWDLYIRQNKKCAISGLDVCLVKIRNKGTTQTASLDRINSAQGYIEGNVQWVHKTVNAIKWDLPQEHFLNLCKVITEHQNKKCSE